MVGLAQPLCLSALGTDGRRYECNMNLRKRKTRGVSFQYRGLDGKHLVFCRRRETFVLTSSFIERDYRNVALSSFRRADFSSSFERFIYRAENYRCCLVRGARRGSEIDGCVGGEHRTDQSPGWGTDHDANEGGNFALDERSAKTA